MQIPGGEQSMGSNKNTMNLVKAFFPQSFFLLENDVL